MKILKDPSVLVWIVMLIIVGLFILEKSTAKTEYEVAKLIKVKSSFDEMAVQEIHTATVVLREDTFEVNVLSNFKYTIGNNVLVVKKIGKLTKIEYSTTLKNITNGTELE